MPDLPRLKLLLSTVNPRVVGEGMAKLCADALKAIDELERELQKAKGAARP